MMIEERLGNVDFTPLSNVKDSLLLRLKLQRQAIIERRNEEMSLEELDYVAAAKAYPAKKFDDNNR